jgi:sulfatase maturation enzyme AslB (radical SAM superfamily)
MITEYSRLRRKICHLRGDAEGVSRWTARMTSEAVLRSLRRQFDENVAPDIHVEINTDCNLKCPFCPQSSNPRPARYMTRSAFLLLVDRLKDLKCKDKVILLDVNNEPFLHPLLLEFCKIVAENLPNWKCHMITNGSLVTKGDLDFMSKLDPSPSLLVDDYTPNRSVSEHFKRMCLDLNSPERIHLYDVTECKHVEESRHNQLWIGLALRSLDEKFGNRAGNQPGYGDRYLLYRRFACTFPFTAMFVTPELRAYLCCNDYQHEMIMGDLSRQSVMEIWKNERYRDIRRRMLATQREDISLCSRCDGVWLIGAYGSGKVFGT